MDKRILIQIAAYCDTELLPTMHDALAKAENPENIGFAVCCQESSDSPIVAELAQFPACRMIQIEPADAKGTCYARAVTQTLLQDEPYVLQIDSHMRFVPAWDTLVLAEWQSCDNPKAILTAYCPSYEPGESLKHPCAFTLGADGFSPFGSLLLRGRMSIDWTAKPVPGAFWSGHFSFSSAQFNKDVPYDENLYFHGEEISMAVRAYTHGYDIFYPNKALCYHSYQRKEHTAHWEQHKDWYLRDVLSQQRVRRLLGMEQSEVDFGVYGLGKARSLQDYERFSGVDFANKSYDAKAYQGWYSDEIRPDKGLAMTPERAGQKILFTTAFYEMGRDKWAYFNRTRALYLEWFARLAALRNLKLVCYYAKELQSELPTGKYTLCDLDKNDTFFKNYYAQECEISHSAAFKTFAGERSANPEHSKPEFSMMTHAKVNFVRRSFQTYKGYTHYAWIDFGIARMPVRPDAVFDWGRLMDDKIHMQGFGNPNDYPSDARTLCLQSPDALSAALFVLPAALVLWYENVYEQELRENHRVQIADDEQNIMLRLAQKYPDKITVNHVCDWYDFFDMSH